MLNIAKCPIKKFSTIFFALSLCGISSVGSVSAQEVTRLQLKVMQTRIFLKHPAEITKAIMTLGKDIGGRCQGIPPMFMGGKQLPDSGVVNCIFLPKPASLNILHFIPVVGWALIAANDLSQSKGTVISYEMEAKPGTDETIVRMRIYGDPDGMKNQIEDPIVYRQAFKELADGLFIDALEISPGVQE